MLTTVDKDIIIDTLSTLVFQTPHTDLNFYKKTQKIIENTKIERCFQTPPTNENFLKKHVFWKNPHLNKYF